MRASTIDVLGGRVRVLECGDASADPVLLIHGVGGWAETWRAALGAIARSGRWAIAPDLPGFGESTAIARARYFDPADPSYARFVFALLDALGVARAHVVGHSLGGAIAYIAAVTSPERVASLALVASGGLGTELPLSLRLATLPGALIFARLDRRRYARAVLESCFYDSASIPQTLLEEADLYGAGSLPESISVLRAGVSLRGVKRRLRDAWMRQAPRYPGPVLVVWGAADRVLPPANAAAAAPLFPGAEVRMIERAGHLVMVERPGAFAQILLPFLDGADRA
ncbi:MAG: alpha/beta fold hydrolase [Chloroflexota bacterium]|nr:alpha/beta fold hydrolase [Chloroflexota bacterium]